MLPEELVALVRDIIAKCCEMQHIEVKKASGGTPQRLYDTLSSFSNQTNGGVIVFGIDESNHYHITGVYDPQELQKKITEQATQMVPVIRPLFTVASIDDKIIVSAEIAECDIIEKPCYYKGAGKIRGSYIRVGDADMPMTEYEVYSYEAFKRKLQDELRAVNAGIGSELNQAALDLFLATLRKEKPNLAPLQNEQILNLTGLTTNGQNTLAGVLLFGLYPQGYYPQLCITAVVIPGYEIGNVGEDEARFIDNKRIEGTLPQMLDGAILFMQRNMHIKTIIDENGKRTDQAEYPIKAVREIILNALIHRDYSVNTENTPIRIMLFKDRLEVENPGGLYGRLTLDNLGKVAADTRNPFIAAALEIMIITENRYSGIPTIYYEMQKAGLPPPEFSNNRSVFKVILYNKNKKEFQFKKDIVYETNESVYFNKSMSISDKILSFCKTPRSREELARAFKFSAMSYMMSTYVQPLIKEGKLKMTMPEKPKSKNQRYVTK